MARDIDSALEAESFSDLVQPVNLVKLELDTPIYVNSTTKTITYDGNDYLGVGGLGGISSVSENSDLSASSINLTLSGVDQAYLSIVMSEDYQQKECTIYFGLLDNSTGGLITPTIIFKGPVDNATVSVDESSGVIDLKVLNQFSKWDKTSPRRYNREDQQFLYPGDNSFNRAIELKNQDFIWGGG